jgi:hypothetical protein
MTIIFLMLSVKVLLFEHFYQETKLNSIKKEQVSNSHKSFLCTIDFSFLCLSQYSQS